MIARAAPAPSNAGQIQQIRKGQAAPFDGVIYDIQAHALLVARTKAFQARLTVELDFLKRKMQLQCQQETRTYKIDLQTARAKLQLETQAKEQQRTFLLGQLNRANKTPWCRQPIFTFSMGFLICALITGLSVYAWQSVSK